MMIRGEKLSDIEAIRDVVKAAFEAHSHSLQTEHYTIADLRDAGALSLSLVSEVEGKIVGHMAVSPVTISDGTMDWHSLGPVSVLPGFQGCRIGTALVNKGLALLRSMGSSGCALVGLPLYHRRFGFRHYPCLIHESAPHEVFVAKPFSRRIPTGTVAFHPAFKQLSVIEKETVADAIVDYDLSGIEVDPANPAVERLLEKEILTKMPDGKVMLQPTALTDYDPYFARVAQFRATEMSRVHKNPMLTAITS